MPSEPSSSSIFPRTDWAELARATEGDEARLDRLIRQYWTPLRIFLAATFPALRDQAETFLQDFAEDKIIKKGWLQQADRKRGHFRDFLKTSLRNFILDRLNRAEVRHAPASLDEIEHDLPGPEAPSEEFDLSWAQTVLAETLKRMEADCKDPAADQPRRSYIWEMFRIRLLEPLLNDAPQVPLRAVDRKIRAALADRRFEPAPERQTHLQGAPEPGHPGIRGAGCGHGSGDPGAGGVSWAGWRTGEMTNDECQMTKKCRMTNT